MGKTADYIGVVFGKMVVVEVKGWVNTQCFVACNCECGTRKVVRLNDLKQGRIVSCGCVRKEKAKALGKNTVTHGLSNHPLYPVYHAMIQRCYKPSMQAYRWYGAKGVTVCDRWLESFKNFLDDVGERPVGLTLDRIDPYGNYQPDNVRWVNWRTQRANKREKELSDGPRRTNRAPMIG